MSNDGWDYGKFGPDVWYKKYPLCGEINQSPINIKTHCTTQETFEPFYFSSNFYENINLKLINDGHTIKGEYNQSLIKLYGANLNGNYTFINFHLHWGPNENVGSEHQINGVKYTGESHFLFENDETGELTVLAFFLKDESNLNLNLNYFDQQNLTRNEWKKYFNSTHKLIHRDDSIIINLNLSLLMPNNLDEFWRYKGSLTIPPCTLNVTWNIFKQVIQIFDYNFELFHQDFFYENYRGPQYLYYRKVYRSFQDEVLSPIPDENICLNQKPISSANSFSFFNNSIYLFIYLFKIILF